MARSVTMKRLLTSARCPSTSSVAGTISGSHTPRWVIRPKCTASRATRIAAVSTAAGPALSRGSRTIRYTATSRNTSFEVAQAQAGETKKSCCRIDETECARVSTGGVAGEIGVTEVVPTPAAVAPIRTILPAYLLAGILPASTS